MDEHYWKRRPADQGTAADASGEPSAAAPEAAPAAGADAGMQTVQLGTWGGGTAPTPPPQAQVQTPSSNMPTMHLGTWSAGPAATPPQAPAPGWAPAPIAPPNWAQPPAPAWAPLAAPKPRRRRKLLLASGVGAVVAAVVAAVAFLPGLSGDHGATASGPHAAPAVPKLHPAVSQAPFMAALNNLAAAPEVHYRSTVGGDPVDIRVTNHGESVGTIADGGASIEVLDVGGKLYMKPPASGLPGVTNKAQLAALNGKWLTGKDVEDLLGDRLADFVPPGQLAERLTKALAASSDVPDGSDPGGAVDGVRVLTAKTSLGSLSVTKDAPYRIVALGGGGDTASSPPSSDGSTTAAAAVFTWKGQHPATPIADEGTGTSFPADPSNESAATDNEIQDDTKQLKNAINGDLQFKLQGNGQISCTAGGCQVSVTVDNSIDPATSNAKITGGQIAAELHADVSIEGRPAGSCDSSGQLPLNNTATMGCSDPGAGGVFTSVEAEKKSEAEAQSKAEGGAEVPYYVHFDGEYYVYATAQVSVDELVQDERNRQAEDPPQDPCSSPNAVPSAFRFAAPAAPSAPGTSSGSSCSTSRLVGPDGKPLANPDPMASKLKNYVDKALDDWNTGKIGYTRDNVNSIATAKNPNALSNALKGSILDDYVKTLVDNDPALKNLFGARSGDYGPDWINTGGSGTTRWYDLTTQRGWSDHVKKYQPRFGPGIGILWN